MIGRRATTGLKGVAILGVVIIHLMTDFYDLTGGVSRVGWILLNQVLRFSVPLFVALSGYGLMKKYGSQELGWWEFVRRRAVKLLPLYLLWVGITLVALWPVDFWNGFFKSFPWWQWILGRADYHLYFVPMIFQLYLLFPVLKPLVTHEPYRTRVVLFSGVLQALFYHALSVEGAHSPFLEPHFKSDQHQYIYFLSWFFYFILGMALARKEKVHKTILFGGAIVMVLGLGVAYFQASEQIGQAANVVMATRFTRLPILVYASGFVVVIVGLLPYLRTLSDGVKIVSGYLGRYSYLIYLAHPILLRLLLDSSRGVVSGVDFGWTLLWWILGLVVSVRLMHRFH